MVRRPMRRLEQPESPREMLGALAQDERATVRSQLAPGERVLATVRAWDCESRHAWALTTRRVLVTGEGGPLLDSFGLDDVTRLDCQPAGVGCALWLYACDQLIELHLANPDEAESFVAAFERVQRDAMVLRIVR